jgi:eukaryotic-like serine/threonine-protein kinase
MLEAIGHYQIRRKIGQGGMGVVYEGWDDRLKRPVAVKAILEHTESKQARGRLWREARSLAQVNHPHVCQVFDVFEEGESLVLIMELLDGQSLAERLVTGSIATSEACVSNTRFSRRCRLFTTSESFTETSSPPMFS